MQQPTAISERGGMDDPIPGKRICTTAIVGSDSVLRGARLRCPWVKTDGGVSILWIAGGHACIGRGQ
jgi:hypothetical protein